MQAFKETPVVCSAREKPYGHNQKLTTICYKVSNFLPEESLNVFVEKFLNKPIES